MQLEAIITEEDFARVLERFLPVKIYLHDEGQETDRWLLLHPARRVTLVPEEGLRITCPAELQWSIAGLSPTVRLDELRVMFRPQVVEKHSGSVVDFVVEVEEAAFHRLPQFVDTPIVKAVNAALAKKKPEWGFTRTLSRTVGFGKLFDAVEALEIRATSGKVRVTVEALTLVVAFDLAFTRKD